MTFRICLLTMLSSFSLTNTSSTALACGGFFCQLVPVNQAAEQIVFRQQGEDHRSDATQNMNVSRRLQPSLL